MPSQERPLLQQHLHYPDQEQKMVVAGTVIKLMDNPLKIMTIFWRNVFVKPLSLLIHHLQRVEST